VGSPTGNDFKHCSYLDNRVRNAGPVPFFITASATPGITPSTWGYYDMDLGKSFSGVGTVPTICRDGGNLGIGMTAPIYKLDLVGKFRFNPGIGADATALVDGDIAFEFTDATHLKIRAKAGGTTRSVILTLT
jgi:hypothetical protein